jgi:hypothetical protein
MRACFSSGSHDGRGRPPTLWRGRPRPRSRARVPTRAMTFWPARRPVLRSLGEGGSPGELVRDAQKIGGLIDGLKSRRNRLRHAAKALKEAPKSTLEMEPGSSFRAWSISMSSFSVKPEQRRDRRLNLLASPDCPLSVRFLAKLP